jgi:transposase
VYDLAPDLLLGGAMSKATTRGKSQKNWKPIFWPSYYLKEKKDMTLAGNTLSEAQLKKHAVNVTKVRKLFRDRALAIVGKADGFDSETYLSTMEKLARRMHKRAPSTLERTNICKEPHLTKKELWKSFDLNAKFKMLYDIIVMKELQKDVAKKYGRSQGYISTQLKRYRKNPTMLRDAIDKADQSRDKAMAVQRVIHDMLDTGIFIGSANDVVEKVEKDKGLKIKPWYARDQLRNQGLKYKKLKPTTTGSNSEKTLVLR